MINLVEFDKSFGKIICGIDEAGRGPLAGPVSMAGCIMPLDNDIINEINDSKKLTEKKREKLFDEIIAVADYHIELVSEAVIDEINILQATKSGMIAIMDKMQAVTQQFLIDGNMPFPKQYAYSSIVGGDAKSYSVASASILAKVTRDRLMYVYDEMYPQYGFCRHKGYGTKEHIMAIKKYGLCPIHRKTFVKNFI